MTLDQIKTSIQVIKCLNFAYKATKNEHYKNRALKALWVLKKGIKDYKKNYNNDDKTLIMAA
jgi:hypothetical protein